MSYVAAVPCLQGLFSTFGTCSILLYSSCQCLGMYSPGGRIVNFTEQVQCFLVFDVKLLNLLVEMHQTFWLIVHLVHGKFHLDSERLTKHFKDNAGLKPSTQKNHHKFRYFHTLIY